MPFLVQARLAQRSAKCKRIHFVVVPDPHGVDGMFRDKRNLYDAEEMHWRLWNIVIPACRMAGGSVTLATDWAEAKRLPGPRDKCWPDDWDRQTLERKHYLIKEIVAASKAGTAIPMLQALEHARRRMHNFTAGRPLVTLTMRNTYEVGRNADKSLWAWFSGLLSDRFHVVRIFDTADEMSRGNGYGALNLELRAALYAEAIQNFHCHGGPVALNWFMDAPFVEFGAAHPLKFWQANWIENVGLHIGEQLPWARPDQRIRYDAITKEAMREELARV